MDKKLTKTLTIYRLNIVRPLKHVDKGKPSNQQKRGSEFNLHLGDADFMSLQNAPVIKKFKNNIIQQQSCTKTSLFVVFFLVSLTVFRFLEMCFYRLLIFKIKSLVLVLVF